MSRNGEVVVLLGSAAIQVTYVFNRVQSTFTNLGISREAPFAAVQKKVISTTIRQKTAGTTVDTEPDNSHPNNHPPRRRVRP